MGKVLSLGKGVTKIVQAAAGEDASLQARVGKKMGALWGPGYQRVKSGSMKGKKIIFPSGIPKPTTNDIYLGNVNPDWIGSIRNQLSFKNITFSFLFGGQFGGVFISRFYNKAMGSGQLLGSAKVRVLVNLGQNTLFRIIFPVRHKCLMEHTNLITIVLMGHTVQEYMVPRQGIL
jgi:hypothetical protein